MKRLFAAIKVTPSDDFRNYFKDLQQSLSRDSIKWVSPDNLHLTIKFFGETENKKIPLIKAVLEEAVASIPEFLFEIRNTGIFGSSYNPRVIWLGVHPEDNVMALANTVLENLAIAGWACDRQNFVPHLTIGRVKSVENKNYFQSVIDRHHETYIQAVSVKEVHLYESILRGEGPVYVKLHSFSLSQA